MKSMEKKTAKNRAKNDRYVHAVTERLDQSLPLNTETWRRVEQLLMQMTEFAPASLVAETVNAIAIYADDQAQRGYILGQEDLIAELRKRAA